MSEPKNYTHLSDREFSDLFEQGYCQQDPQFYAEFQRRMSQGRHYNPNTDPQAWEKCNAEMIAFMDRVGLPH